MSKLPNQNVAPSANSHPKCHLLLKAPSSLVAKISQMLLHLSESCSPDLPTSGHWLLPKLQHSLQSFSVLGGSSVLTPTVPSLNRGLSHPYSRNIKMKSSLFFSQLERSFKTCQQWKQSFTFEADSFALGISLEYFYKHNNHHCSWRKILSHL